MDEAELAGALAAGLCCFGSWVVLGGGVGWLAHWRMRSVERRDGCRAEPPKEQRWLWYAGAATVWLTAAILALVGLSRRDRVRVGRNCTFILLGHFTVVTIGAVVLATASGPGRADPLPVIVFACIVAGGGMTVAPIFAAIWAHQRAGRIAAQAPEGNPPGLERFLLYAGSLLLWPLGLVMAAVYSKPENARAGATCMSMSLLQLWLIAVAVCIVLPVLLSAAPDLLS